MHKTRRIKPEIKLAPLLECQINQRGFVEEGRRQEAEGRRDN
ncbi:hypothetical protein COO91_06493 [Nostoc flagelliforme CCNUN1]|uniref:Uncharacterized protein n=1 Tax=Nostoc flagelliforme CCNUN1 TaxID=2038116 RepID=A0A2K8SYF5_9NOSO|nr:hypothetical protein COO91_06493 [Nostoc flagelliforme CCNUN1]